MSEPHSGEVERLRRAKAFWKGVALISLTALVIVLLWGTFLVSGVYKERDGFRAQAEAAMREAEQERQTALRRAQEELRLAEQTLKSLLQRVDETDEKGPLHQRIKQLLNRGKE
jgi:hypothetical protein